jgi:hypothetical protein
MVTSSLKPEKFLILRVLGNVDILLPLKMQDNSLCTLAFLSIIRLNRLHVEYQQSVDLGFRRLLQ